MDQKFKTLLVLPVLMFLFFSSYGQRKYYHTVQLPGQYVMDNLSNVNFERFKFQYKKRDGKFILRVKPFTNTGTSGDKFDLTPSDGGLELYNHGRRSKLHLTRDMMDRYSMDGNCDFYIFTPLQWDYDGRRYVRYRVTGLRCVQNIHGKIFTDFTFDPSPPATVPLH